MHCPHCHNEIINNQEIRQTIKEELMHLDPDVANSLANQVIARLGNHMRMQGSFRAYETKAAPSKEIDEP
ncbi:MAG: hypothetical protein AUF65_00480 [Chloroflexi bacterium 13_1_20CM_50_12]|nr:MAG: hypothetical protein AUF65_00480 [Chloroflexi bacterium 13_1_20CM_50_12]